MDPSTDLERAQELWARAPFVAEVGVELLGIGPGWAESELVVAPRHTQADGFVHAGVVATMADHTAGVGAGSLVEPGKLVLTVEFKVNLLRPAMGERLRCRAEVVKPGRRLVVAEARVLALQHGDEQLVATFTSTLAVVATLDSP